LVKVRREAEGGDQRQGEGEGSQEKEEESDRQSEDGVIQT
jgi:hypothetical protein